MTHLRNNLILLVFSLALLAVLAACTSAATPVPIVEVATAAPTVAPADTPAPEPTLPPQPTAQLNPTDTPEPTVTSIPVATPEPTSAPTLGERLLAEFPGEPQAQGEVILVTGRVLDANGEPVANAAVEFWQTDANGVYDHPGDASTGSRDQTFQFYGTSITDADGRYAFRTISPGYYEPRPKHIHVKVKLDGREVLTTQFYFEEDRDGLAGEGLFRQAGDQGELLILKAAENVAANGGNMRVLTNDLVIDTGIGAGSLTLTPAQGEGPYYPVVNVADYDNDLVIR